MNRQEYYWSKHELRRRIRDERVWQQSHRKCGLNDIPERFDTPDWMGPFAGFTYAERQLLLAKPAKIEGRLPINPRGKAAAFAYGGPHPLAKRVAFRRLMKKWEVDYSPAGRFAVEQPKSHELYPGEFARREGFRA